MAVTNRTISLPKMVPVSPLFLGPHLPIVLDDDRPHVLPGSGYSARQHVKRLRRRLRVSVCTFAGFGTVLIDGRRGLSFALQCVHQSSVGVRGSYHAQMNDMNVKQTHSLDGPCGRQGGRSCIEKTKLYFGRLLGCTIDCRTTHTHRQKQC